MVTHLNIIYQNPLSEHILLHHSQREFQQTNIDRDDDDDSNDDDDDDDDHYVDVEIIWRRMKCQDDQMKQTWTWTDFFSHISLLAFEFYQRIDFMLMVMNGTNDEWMDNCICK